MENNAQKAKLVQIIAEAIVTHARGSDDVPGYDACVTAAMREARAIYTALLSAGALAQGGGITDATLRNMIEQVLIVYHATHLNKEMQMHGMLQAARGALAQGGGDFHYTSVLKWAISEPRKPANLSFSEGPERTAAYLIEQYDSARERGYAEPVKQVSEGVPILTAHKRRELRDVLAEHHKWHQEIGMVRLVANEESGLLEPVDLDMSLEYQDSSLCEKTERALYGAVPTAPRTEPQHSNVAQSVERNQQDQAVWVAPLPAPRVVEVEGAIPSVASSAEPDVRELVREYLEADDLVSRIYDEASPGLNTPRPQDHYDRLGKAIERRLAARAALAAYEATTKTEGGM